MVMKFDQNEESKILKFSRHVEHIIATSILEISISQYFSHILQVVWQMLSTIQPVVISSSPERTLAKFRPWF